MRTYLIIFKTALLISLCYSCQTESDIEPNLLINNQTGFVKGEIREPEQSSFTPFEIKIGRYENEDGYDAQFWQSDVSQGESGPTLIVGTYNAFYALSTVPVFGLQFWAEELPATRVWNAEELETFFAPGTNFEFGEGFGKVDLMMNLPIDNPAGVKASRSTFLATPQGHLTITAIEDLDYPVYGRTSERRYGKLVHCTFSGQIGRYDSLADQADGDPSFFQTDEVVEIENGEAVFYVNYDEQ